MTLQIFVLCLDAMAVAGLIGLAIVLLWGLLALAHLLLTLPMRRAERARLFLDEIASAVHQGRPVEETLISLAHSRDLSMGVHFHLLTAWLEEGFNLDGALANVPRFLPPQINATLRAGLKMAELKKVLPACRQLLTDATSQTRAAINYLVVLTFVITPMSLFVAGLLQIKVMPKFRELSEGTGFGMAHSGFNFIYDNFPLLIGIQGFVLLCLWAAVLAYIAGPQLVAWFPFLDELRYWIPWRRKRLQRDFSTMLSVLLDSGVPEAAAVALAADCTANGTFQRRAAQVAAQLKGGLTLPQAVASLDESGEFSWRLANAIHGQGGFFRALAGWHESLDARAFQQEQAAAHVVSTALVLWTGVFVGVIAISIFAFLISITNGGVLW